MDYSLKDVESRAGRVQELLDLDGQELCEEVKAGGGYFRKWEKI
jgi:hypothetical protein